MYIHGIHQSLRSLLPILCGILSIVSFSSSGPGIPHLKYGVRRAVSIYGYPIAEIAAVHKDRTRSQVQRSECGDHKGDTGAI